MVGTERNEGVWGGVFIDVNQMGRVEAGFNYIFFRPCTVQRHVKLKVFR